MLALTLCLAGLFLPVFFVTANAAETQPSPQLLAQIDFTCPEPARPNPDPGPLWRPQRGVCLMQPLDAPATGNGGTTNIPITAGIGVFYHYFGIAWPWLIGTAAGIAVLQALAGGIQIMLSGGSEQRSAGQSRLTWALAGLLLVGLTAVILRLLNPIFYR